MLLMNRLQLSYVVVAGRVDVVIFGVVVTVVVVVSVGVGCGVVYKFSCGVVVSGVFVCGCGGRLIWCYWCYSC